MSNDRNSNFWKNVVTGVGVAAAGAALAYFVSELFNEEGEARYDGCGRAVLPRDSSKILRDEIIENLNRGTYECVVCCEEITRNDKVVFCKKCYNIFHLNCIRRHCNFSNGSGRNPTCPICRIDINYKLEYYCFCGTVLNPKPRDGATPHSCESKCTNRNCNQNCHPGPCSTL